MGHYLLTGRYTAEALRGMIETAEDRTKASGALLAAFGGRMDRYFMALGGADFVMMTEFPDNEAAMSCTAVVVASGTVLDFEITPLVPMDKMPDIFNAAKAATGGYQKAGR